MNQSADPRLSAVLPHAAIDTAPELEVSAVSKAYGPVRVLSDVSMRVRRGAIHGLLGKNGAGKSTLSGIIAGFVAPDSGRLILDGEDIGTLSMWRHR